MDERGQSSPDAVRTSTQPTEGWHCSHFFYRFRRGALQALDAAAREQGRGEFVQALDPSGDMAPARLQTSIVSGHRADFALMLMDPDPLKIDAVHQRLLAGSLGHALEATYSFVSMTEVSEYVPSVEQYRERLIGRRGNGGQSRLDGQGESVRAARADDATPAVDA